MVMGCVNQTYICGEEDYIKKLSKADKQWLDKFNNEYYRGIFTNHPLHTTLKQKRECYTRNNKAQVDALTSNRTELLPITEYKHSIDDLSAIEMLIDLNRIINRTMPTSDITLYHIREAYKLYKIGE